MINSVPILDELVHSPNQLNLQAITEIWESVVLQLPLIAIGIIRDTLVFNFIMKHFLVFKHYNS